MSKATTTTKTTTKTAKISKEKANKEYVEMLHDRDLLEVDNILQALETAIALVATHLAHADFDVINLVGNPVLDAGTKCGQAWDAIDSYRCALEKLGGTDKQIKKAFDDRKKELSNRETFQAVYRALKDVIRKSDRK